MTGAPPRNPPPLASSNSHETSSAGSVDSHWEQPEQSQPCVSICAHVNPDRLYPMLHVAQAIAQYAHSSSSSADVKSVEQAAHPEQSQPNKDSRYSLGRRSGVIDKSDSWTKV